MKRFARLIPAVFLALALVVTSVQLAVARGQPMAAGTMEICAGQGVITVYVDAEGNPVGDPHVCHDSLLTFFVSVGGAIPLVLGNAEWRSVARVYPSVGDLQQIRLSASARGPPLEV